MVVLYWRAMGFIARMIIENGTTYGRSWEKSSRSGECYEARTRVRRGGTQWRAGDTAARASCRVVPHGFHVFLADSCRRGSDSGRFARNRANSGMNRPQRPIQAEIQKKKKKVQNAPFDLYLNPTSAQFTQTPKHKLSTSPHISSLTCLCALYLFYLVLISNLWVVF